MLKPLVILDWSTNAYHPLNLGRSRPRAAFTNCYHREEGTRHRPTYSGRWPASGRVVHSYRSRSRGEPYTHSRRVRTVAGRCRKDFSEKIFLGRIAFNEHGGKTGRAMIKYPPYKKNAQRKNTLVYPGLTTVSLDRIINLCRTTMF